MELPHARPPLASGGLGAAWRPSRRQLLKTGLLGTLSLAAAGWSARWLSGTALAATERAFIRSQDEALARAVIQAFVGWAMPQEPTARRAAVDQALLSADAYFASFSPAVQEEAQQAFDLLNLTLVRWLVAGVWSPWESASAAEVNAFLEGFRTSRFAMLRQIFQLLEGVATVGWFSQPASWAAIGYPGPPQLRRPTGEQPL